MKTRRVHPSVQTAATSEPPAAVGGRRRAAVTAVLVSGALLFGVIGCASSPDQSANTQPSEAANPTTASGEGAGGGPAPGASSTSTASTADIPGGKTVSVTGKLSAVRASPDSKIIVCSYLTTSDDVFALEVTERQYTVIANVEPIQLEIKDAKTKAAIAKLGQSVKVDGISHPDPTPIGGSSYRCDGATAYLKVTSIEPA